MIPPAAPPPAPIPPDRLARIRAQAQALETAFLAEMLRSAGTVRMGSGLPDQSPEAPFDPFLAEAQARALMAAGGLGLTESLVSALIRRDAPRGAA
jgi:peptidoglycan hydrolase FlgJ